MEKFRALFSVRNRIQWTKMLKKGSDRNWGTTRAKSRVFAGWNVFHVLNVVPDMCYPIPKGI